jgi:hypothetical protein
MRLIATIPKGLFRIKKTISIGSVCVMGGGNLIKGIAGKALNHDVLDLLVIDAPKKRRPARAARVVK